MGNISIAESAIEWRPMTNARGEAERLRAEIHAAAKRYEGRGWKPVPLKYRTKKPVGDDWPNAAVDIDREFNGELRNLGIQMGKASDGLSDVDLDTNEARAA
jgi:hypothetical protein